MLPSRTSSGPDRIKQEEQDRLLAGQIKLEQEISEERAARVEAERQLVRRLASQEAAERQRDRGLAEQAAREEAEWIAR